VSLSSRPTIEAAVVRVRLYRYDPQTDAEPRYEDYEVPHAPRMRIMDVLDHIHEQLAVDFGYRWLCGSKKCGTCAVTVNGTPRLACWEEAEAVMTIEPLRNLPVVRDLVVSRDPHDQGLARLQPLLARAEPYRGFPEPLSATDMAPAYHLRDCIQCLACVSACPVLAQADTGFAGPAQLVALAELALDPRDGADRAAMADEAARVFQCVSCYECERVCPTHIPVVGEAIEPLKRLAYRRGASDGARRARAFIDVVREHGYVNAPKVAAKTKSGRWRATDVALAARMIRRGKMKLTDALGKPPTAGAERLRRILDDKEDKQ
jgi:succinate dehydrogenase/fumarate reductase iron-sulfur protein